jgi:calcineurin-like phosphoesterase family protein
MERRNNMRTFFTSDSHFGHDNIIKHCGRPCRERPFRDSAQMDRALMDAWNSVVSPGDVVYHLGDFSLRPVETIQGLLKKLHGTKHLIVGNHDRTHGVTGWSSVREMDKIDVDGQSVFLCHYPMREWPGMWQGTVHLYGHVHGNLQPMPGSMEVSADVWGGKPVQMMDILDSVMLFDAESEKQQRQSLRLRDWD